MSEALPQVLRMVTSFGDPAATLTVAALILSWLATMVSWGLAARWIVAVGGCGLVLTAQFGMFHHWSALFSPIGLRVPSGHVAGSVIAYGGIALVAWHGLSGWGRVAAALGGAIPIVAVAASRWGLGAHTVAEILVGGGAALVWLAWFAVGYARLGVPARNWRGAVTASAAAVALTYGLTLNVWSMIRGALLHLRAVL
jgi:hypothetical protein